MGTLRNIPSQTTLLTLATRKSFSFTVQFLDDVDRPLSLQDASVSFTIGQQSAHSDTPILTQQASTIVADKAVALFDLQASQLNLTPGTYPYEVVVTVGGYSSIAVSGELEIVESHEVLSLSQQYTTAPGSFGLVARLKQNRLVVSSNTLMVPGPPGPEGKPGVDGNPFGEVLITYDGEGRISSLTIGEETTTYLYNPDGTIAYDERNGVTRNYIYTGGILTSIEPQNGL